MSDLWKICEQLLPYFAYLLYIFFSWCSIEDKGVNIISWNWILFVCAVIGLICRWNGIFFFVMLSNFIFLLLLFIFLAWVLNGKWFLFLVPTTINWKLLGCNMTDILMVVPANVQHIIGHVLKTMHWSNDTILRTTSGSAASRQWIQPFGPVSDWRTK